MKTKVLNELLIQTKYPRDRKPEKVCKICLQPYSEATYKEHKLTDKHIKFIELNKVMKKLGLN